MIDTIVFDIGAVLKGWHPERVRDYYDEKTATIVTDAIWGSGYWQQMDLGIETDQVLLERMLAWAPDYKEAIEDQFFHMDRISEKLPYAIPWVQELKAAGYKVYYLSNYSRHLRTTVPQTLGFLPFMDGGIFSCDVNLLKPDRRIYELLCTKYGLEPSHCLFIDDRQENVDAAIDYGMQAVRFDGYEETYPVIQAMLGMTKRDSQ